MPGDETLEHTPIAKADGDALIVENWNDDREAVLAYGDGIQRRIRTELHKRSHSGFLFDAFVVRMTFVPAVMTLLGKSAWYMPKWLDKILPKFDIEGEALEKKEDIA